MIHHEFDPWAEIDRLRRQPAKAAKPAKAGGHFSSVSSFSTGARPRCRRCQSLEALGVNVLRCSECGFAARQRPWRGPLDRPDDPNASGALGEGITETREALDD